MLIQEDSQRVFPVFGSAHATREDYETLILVSVENCSVVDMLSCPVHSEVKSSHAAASALPASLAAFAASELVPTECLRPSTDESARSENVESEEAHEKEVSSCASGA